MLDIIGICPGNCAAGLRPFSCGSVSGDNPTGPLDAAAPHVRSSPRFGSRLSSLPGGAGVCVHGLATAARAIKPTPAILDPVSRWWRELKRTAVCAIPPKLAQSRTAIAGDPSGPGATAPSRVSSASPPRRNWYRAHNVSIVAGLFWQPRISPRPERRVEAVLHQRGSRSACLFAQRVGGSATGWP